MTHKSLLLGVNIDHIATLRQARLTRYPDPIEAVYAAENGGADGITVHLREDRRHINERDVELIQAVLLTRLNLEMAVNDVMVDYALKIMPAHVCFVPEKRDELTTEGGLNVIGSENQVKQAVERLQDKGIEVSLFIDPELNQIEAALRTGAQAIELHTGCYADAKSKKDVKNELQRIQTAAQFAYREGLIVNAGHGLHYQNTQAIAAIPELNELNIGHGIVSRALFSGLENAVREMKTIMRNSR